MNISSKAIIQIKSNKYLLVLAIVAPLLNFLAGINVDLFSPSLPSIAQHFSTSYALAKNTITVSVIGFAIGCLIFGPIFDAIGRRKTILYGLICYSIASLFALVCASIDQLLIIRFIQGAMIAAVSIGCRTIVVDTFSGQKMNVVLLYTSIAYGLGPIIGPFIGGILQYHFGWKANFLAFALLSGLLLMMFCLLVNETLEEKKSTTIRKTVINYLGVLQNKSFLTGIVILGCCQFITLVFPTVGAFLIVHTLRGTVLTYGYSALTISCGYLLGSLSNRVLLQHFKINHIIQLGFSLLLIALIMQITFAKTIGTSLFSIILPITLMGYSIGFIFSNTMASCFKLFKDGIGVVSAVMISLCMAITALGLFIVSHEKINSLVGLSNVFFTAILIAFFAYFLYFKKFVAAPCRS